MSKQDINSLVPSRDLEKIFAEPIKMETINKIVSTLVQIVSRRRDWIVKGEAKKKITLILNSIGEAYNRSQAKQVPFPTEFSERALNTFIKRASGVECLNNWLHSQTNSSKLIQTALVDFKLQKFRKFRISDFASTPFLKLEKDVNEIFFWLKMIQSIMKNGAINRHYFIGLSEFSYKGLQKRIFLTFIIGLTLNKSSEIFNLPDLAKFVLKLEEFKKWQKIIENKIFAIFDAWGDKDLGHQVINQPAYQRLIKNFKEEKIDPISLGQSLSLISENKRVLEKAKGFVRRVSVRSLNRKEEDKETAEDLYNRKLMSRHPQLIYNLCQAYPWSAYWFDIELMIPILALAKAKGNIKLIKEVCKFIDSSQAEEIKSALEDSYPLYYFFDLLFGDGNIKISNWQTDNLFESGVGGQRRLKSWYNPEAQNFIHTRLSTLLNSLEIGDLAQHLNALYEIDEVKIPESLISKETQVSLYILEKEIPTYISKRAIQYLKEFNLNNAPMKKYIRSDIERLRRYKKEKSQGR